MITVDPNTGAATSREYYHANRLGSVIAMADETGTLTAQYVYTPFGVEDAYNASGNPFRYTGRRLDAQWGIYYYRARYYDPQIGRFLETDPAWYVDSMNLYAYVQNDPINMTDPTGMCTGSRLTNSDGTCAQNGGWTTDLAGDGEGMERSRALRNLGALILPDESHREQKRLGTAIYEAVQLAEAGRDYFNSRQANRGRFDTSYGGFDVGVYIRRLRNFFGDDNFKAGRPNINAPSGYGESTGMAPLQGPGRVTATLIAPTPHDYPGDRPDDQRYAQYVDRNRSSYQDTSRLTRAPVIVVTPKKVYLLGMPQ